MRPYLPYVFTEQGVSMLSAVLRSSIAVEVSIKVIDSFVEIRKFITQNTLLFQKIDITDEKIYHLGASLKAPQSNCSCSNLRNPLTYRSFSFLFYQQIIEIFTDY